MLKQAGLSFEDSCFLGRICGRCMDFHPDNKWSLCCHQSLEFGRPVKGSVAHMTCCVNGLTPKCFVVRVLILVGCSIFCHWNKSTFTSLRNKFSFAVPSLHIAW